MNFYFCEKCGKRLTEHDVAAGEARNKKLAGVFCTECAVGILTLETLPLTDAGAREVLQKEKVRPAAQPSQGRPLRRSSGIRVAREAQPPGRAVQSKAPGKPQSRNRSLVPVLGAIAGLAALGTLFLMLSGSGQARSEQTAPNKKEGPTTTEPLRPQEPLIKRPPSSAAQPEIPQTQPESKTPEKAQPQPTPPPDPAAASFERLGAMPGATPEERELRLAAAEAFLNAHPDSILAARVKVLLDSWTPVQTPSSTPTPKTAPPPAAKTSEPSEAADPPDHDSDPLPPVLTEPAPGQLPFVSVPAEETGIPAQLYGPVRSAVVHAWYDSAKKSLEVFCVAMEEDRSTVRLKGVLRHKEGFRFEVVPTASLQWPLGMNGPAWWDLDGDGKPEAWLGRIYKRGADGAWLPFAQPLPGDWIDLDGDGYLEELFLGGDQRPGAAQTVQPKLRAWMSQPFAALELDTIWGAKSLLAAPPDTDGLYFTNALSVDLNGDHRNELILHGTTGKDRGNLCFTWILSLGNPAAGPKGWMDATAAMGLAPGPGHLYCPEDIDADGDLDLVNCVGGPSLMNDGRGKFKANELVMVDLNRRVAKRASRMGGLPTIASMPELLDLDNNGFRDFVFSSYGNDWYSGTFMNRGGGAFEEVDPLTSKHASTAYVDLDGDGKLDVLHASKRLEVRRNVSKQHGLHVLVRPRFAVTAFMGAKLWVYEAATDERAKPKLIHYRQGYAPADLNPRLHVGLGDAESVDIKIRFPSGVERWQRGARAGTEVEVRE
ncbi:MAG: FG-GAP-like repeat-containing protein [Planctomycetota bacterium]|nr:FG-GAP-like repeat-containing protein [Planctomycetota bacterium]